MEESNIRQRGKKMLLRVTFPDGKILCYKSATMTFIETLRKIGIDKLKSINMECAHIPLFSQKIYPEYEEWQKYLGNGWYVMTQSDGRQKYIQLTSIKQQLDLNITIELGTDFETDKSKMFQKAKKEKSNLLVKFPDGVYVGGESPVNTYIETIKRLGVDLLSRKGYEIGGKPLFTSSQQFRGQIEIDNNKWLTIPSQTKDKIKYLKIISALQRIPLEITTI